MATVGVKGLIGAVIYDSVSQLRQVTQAINRNRKLNYVPNLSIACWNEWGLQVHTNTIVKPATVRSLLSNE